jgi:hypothetical protein
MNPPGSSVDEEFESAFWKEDYRVRVDNTPVPAAFAQLTLSNERVDADPDTFHDTIKRTAAKFVELMSRI